MGICADCTRSTLLVRSHLCVCCPRPARKSRLQNGSAHPPAPLEASITHLDLRRHHEPHLHLPRLPGVHRPMTPSQVTARTGAGAFRT
jgi:hypothetical protein